MKQQGDWFNEETGKKASVAATGILKWSLALNEYHEKFLAKLKEKFTIQQEAKLQLEARAAKTKKKINTAR